ncbi:MAG: MATE family efflux transporter [Ruminococcaceae bacterium]|nr:MATE family efflux transporter [Oscillospiraceae bacterium]
MIKEKQKEGPSMDAKGEQKQQDRKLMMLNQPIHRVIPKMAIPTIVAFLINSIYSLADTYFVSSLGTNATAAVSVNASLDQLIMMCGSMLAMGANSYIARLLGKNEDKKASQVLSTAFFSAFAIGALLLIFGTVFMVPMVRLLGATPTCEAYSIDYATYVLMAAPFMACNFVMNQCLRSEGSATLSMVGMGFGGILNCILDPIFIFGFEMGVAGASLATAISKVVSFAILIFPYITRRSLLHLSIRNFKPTRDIVTEVVSVGSSSMFRSGLAVVAGILLNTLAGNISDSVLAGIGVCTKIMMFPFSIILGFGNGFQPVVGFNWGAKRYDRVQEAYRFSSKVAFWGSVAMAAFCIVFADQLIILFAGTDGEMRRIGAFAIITQAIALPIHAWVAIVNMLCVGLGNAKGAFALATARQGTCFIPILFPLAWIFGAYGVGSVQALADVLTMALAVPIIRGMNKKIKAAMEEQAAAV